MIADAAFADRLGDVYRDVLALMTAVLDGDDDGKTAVLSAWEGTDAVPLLFAAIGRLLGLVAEYQGDTGGIRAWIAAERGETFRK